jgi:hypothetical protein
MAGAEKLAQKVPGWVERVLIPTLESRARAIVKDEVGNLEKVIGARFDAVDTRIDALEKRIPVIQDIADIKARLAVIEGRGQR